MKYWNETKEAVTEVYRNKVYWIITLLFAILVFSFNAVITNYKLLLSSFSVPLVFNLVIGSVNAISKVSLVMLILMSLQAGLVLAMSVYLLRRQVTSSAAAGSSSALVSLIAPACPSCAFGLLSMLGMGGFLAVLPFKGYELGVLGIAVLVGSMIYLARKINTKVCAVKLPLGEK